MSNNEKTPKPTVDNPYSLALEVMKILGPLGTIAALAVYGFLQFQNVANQHQKDLFEARKKAMEENRKDSLHA
ncbi:MAG: hypothetical protein AABZ47_16220 [Planctomycetota bacterium]